MSVPLMRDQSMDDRRYSIVDKIDSSLDSND